MLVIAALAVTVAIGILRGASAPVEHVVIDEGGSDAATSAGRLRRDITKLIAVRHTTPEFDGARLIGFDVPVPSVVGYQRPGDGTVVLVLANVAAEPVHVPAVTLSGFAPTALDLVEGVDVGIDEGLTLPACGFRWLRVSPVA